MLRPKKVPKEDKPFTRRSRPTPQATRLLFTSSMAGVLLIIVLAVVFVPRGLDWEGRQGPRGTLQFGPPPLPVKTPQAANVPWRCDHGPPLLASTRHCPPAPDALRGD